ncbi:MAG: bifunctional 4-hydroxy-2-oxoglutarate aldolase/2-dehydro-3-deoxy-phosphogluconate aldolase, partial [Treponema sp.]|nr:bifunctional 4-hydroxy-2-oxoglutarate aldolase/2-dehydro-3-deoxy-phosphogluconate aldolase [Treponema sp.]
AAGAKFIVTPGFNPRVVSYCIEKNIPITPGCSNPSDIEKALEMGLDTVKFFPAEQSGGLEYIKAIAAPYSSMSFIPTGGINAGNIAKYISYEKILACGGSWMVNTDLINTGDFDKITSLCKEALFNMLGFEIAHVGINAENEDAAMRAAIHFSVMFGFQNKIGNTSIFSGERIEIVKSPIHGKNGHIAVATNSFIRARAFLERFGIEFEANSLKMDSKGNPVSIYLKEEVCSFAIQLVQRK